jgi:hypothetical protein
VGKLAEKDAEFTTNSLGKLDSPNDIVGLNSSHRAVARSLLNSQMIDIG